MLHTADYKQALQAMHGDAAHWGSTAGRFASQVEDFAKAVEAADILDYGCGKQALSKALPQLNIKGYDPGIEGLDSEPEPADLVVCIDVLEHVEPELIDNVLAHIRSKATKGVFLLISTRKAIAVLPDGRNAHLIVRPASWWIKKVQELFPRISEIGYGDDEVLIKARIE